MAQPFPPGPAQAPSTSATASAAPRNRTIYVLAWVVLAGIALYLALDVLLQLLPPHYDAVRVPESDYVHGPYGALMSINFVVRGAFSFALLAGLALCGPAGGLSRAGLMLLGVWAAGAWGLAVFPATPYGGRLTPSGAIHLVFALLAFLAVTGSQVLLARSFVRDQRWAPFAGVATALATLTSLTFLVLEVAPLAIHRLARIGGLTERIFLASAILWMLATAVRLLAVASDSRASLPAAQ